MYLGTPFQQMWVYKRDQSHKSHNASVPYPTIHHSGHISGSELCFVGHRTDGLWGLWIWSIEAPFSQRNTFDITSALWMIMLKKIGYNLDRFTKWPHKQRLGILFNHIKTANLKALITWKLKLYCDCFSTEQTPLLMWLKISKDQ